MILSLIFLVGGVIFWWKSYRYILTAHQKADLIYKWMQNIDAKLICLELAGEALEERHTNLSKKVTDIDIEVAEWTHMNSR